MPLPILPSWDDSQLCSLLDSLSPAEQVSLQNDLSAVVPWTPYPGPQSQAFLSEAEELYYGGAAGGGKTALAIGLALTQHRNSLILRRQSVDTKGIVEMIRSIPKAGKWRSSGYGGELRTSDGRLIEVGGCQWEEDWQKYAGQPHDFIDLDELPQFTFRQYSMLTAWNRVAQPARYPNQRCRVIGGGNPPLTPEGEWVLKRWGAWLDPVHGPLAAPGSVRWYVSMGDDDREVPGPAAVTIKGKPVRPRSRTFIPARLEDNPGLFDTGYDATLDALPEPIRSALRHGDMTAGRQDDRWQLIPTRWVVEAQKRWVDRVKKLGPLSAMGVDVGMSPGEGDKTVLAPRHGATIGTLIKKPSRETPDGQSVVNLLLAASVGAVPVNIDAIGIGKSAYDAAVMMRIGWPNAIIVSQGTEWKDPNIPGIHFANLRAAIMWNVRILLDPEGGSAETRLALPPDPELLTDLTAPRYKLQLQGIAVEAKEDVRKRIGRSTDSGDAVALACWLTSTPDGYGSDSSGKRMPSRTAGLPRGVFG